MKAKDYFKGMGPNFMTPEPIEYIDTDEYMIELSKGEGFDHEPIYGVTVATSEGTRLYGDSQMFFSEEDAREHIDGLISLEVGN